MKTKSEYVEFVKAQNNRTNVYTTVYDFEEFAEKAKIESSVILDKVFLDFDAHGDSLQNAYADLKTVLEILYEDDLKHVCFFSGRGFHLFVYGEITNDIRNIQAYFRQLRKQLKSIVNYEITLDDRVGQATRLRRVPNTVNMSSSNEEGKPYYCIPIFKEDLMKGLGHILSLAMKPRFIPRRVTGKNLIQWPNLPPIEAVEGEVIAPVLEGRLPMLPCIHNAIMVENPSHMARAYLVAWYRDLLSGCMPLNSQEDKRKVLDLIVEEIKWIATEHEEVWLDWDEGETRRHARFTVFNNYKTPHCKTKLIPEGYCIGKCWRYPENEGGNNNERKLETQ